MAKLCTNELVSMDRNSGQRCWVAAYTRSRHEQHVAAQLRHKNLEYLLPTYQRLSRWSDRIKRVETPLFPSYVFIHICQAERLPVLETLGIVQLVSVAGSVAVLSDPEIDRLRSCCLRSADIEPHPNWRSGKREARTIRRMGRYSDREAEFPQADHNHRTDHEVDRNQYPRGRRRTSLTRFEPL
jgi:hypothetical protein